MIRTLLGSALGVLALSLFTPMTVQSSESIRVVATFSILGDMVEIVGAEHVSLTVLVGPNGDTHVYQPTPAAAQAVGEADILIVNGLEFEGWLERLIDATDFDGMRVVATTGIEPIALDDGHGDNAYADHGDDHGHDGHGDAHHDDDDDHGEGHHGDDHGHDGHGDAHHDDDHDEHADGHDDHHHGAFDPHAWQSLRHAVTYVDNITAALAQADPVNATAFYQNRAAYVAEIELLDAEIRDVLSGLPSARRTIVTSHDAFQYFGRDYGLTFVAPQGISTESEASAKDVARLIQHIRDEGISAVFVENIADGRLLEQIANETGASVGGILFTGALSAPDGPAPTYLEMLRHNAMTLAQALAP